MSAILCGNENQPAKKPRSDGSNDGAGGGRDHLAYDCLLRNELLDADIEELRTPPTNYADGNKSALGSLQVSPATKCKPVFRFRAPVHSAEVSLLNNINKLFLNFSPLCSSKWYGNVYGKLFISRSLGYA